MATMGSGSGGERRTGRRAWLWVLGLAATATLVASCARPVPGVPALSSPGASPAPTAAPTTASLGSTSTLATATCEQTPGGVEPERVDPAAVHLDGDAMDDALAYATARGAQSVMVYRHGCLVGLSGWDGAGPWTAMPMWSMSKGVVAVVVGRAVTEGRLGVDDPIGAHLEGLDPAHAAITVRQLLNQTSGLRFAWANDLNQAATGDSAALVLQREFEATPGERFIYAQTTVTALVAVVEAAVGEDFQTYAARQVFEPIGIPTSQWSWQRDGVGRTQGFAFLEMSPRSVARLGSLLLHGGTWQGRRIIDADYIRQGTVGSAANPGYGFLWRTNAGSWHVASGYVDEDHLERRWIPAATPDMYAFSGMFNQNLFVIPSLDIVIVRMGLPQQLFADPMGMVQGRQPSWEHRFFRTLLGGVTDVELPDPGDWVPDPDFDEVDVDHVIGLF